MRYDFLVVGAGPAGATTAYVLSEGGAKVLLIDTKRSPGVPVQCAEFVPAQLIHRFPSFFPPDSIAQRVSDMIHFTPWGETVVMGSQGAVLHRMKFDARIVELARKSGAELRLRTRFLGFEDGHVWLEHIDTRNRYRVRASTVVGADGPRSKVARLTGEYTKTFLATAQLTMPLTRPIGDLLIYFRDYIPGGYGWIFPKGEVANVGVGIDTSYSVGVMEVLREFVREVVALGVVKEKILGRTGGWIPAEGVKAPVRKRVLLVGDAGGFCHPITGGGIANAVYTGAMAGEALLSGSPEDYEEEVLDVFGDTLRRAALKRVKYMKSWEDLSFIIPRTWIAFEEYWKED